MAHLSEMLHSIIIAAIHIGFCLKCNNLFSLSVSSKVLNPMSQVLKMIKSLPLTLLLSSKLHKLQSCVFLETM